MSEFKAFNQVAYWRDTQIKIDINCLPPGGLLQLISDGKVDMHYENIEGEEVSKKEIVFMYNKWWDECV